MFELFSHEGFTLSTDKIFTEDESGIWFSIWVNNGTDKKLVVTENCVSVNLYIVANPKNVTINGSETEGANEVAFDLQVYIKEPEMSIIETVTVSFTIE